MTTIFNSQKAFYLILKTTVLFFLSFFAIETTAQLPDSKNNIVYSVTGLTIYNYDPTLPVEKGVNPRPNKICLPEGAKSCVVACKNLNGNSPAMTFYTIVDGYFYYHNGIEWVNTKHSCYDPKMNHMMVSGNYLYNFTENTNQIIVYNGKENSILLTKVDFGASSTEIQLKNDFGKYYIFKGNNLSRSSSGTMSSKNGASGMPNLINGGGFAIIDGFMYVSNLEEFNSGSEEGNSIIFESSTICYPASTIKN